MYMYYAIHMLASCLCAYTTNNMHHDCHMKIGGRYPIISSENIIICPLMPGVDNATVIHNTEELGDY